MTDRRAFKTCTEITFLVGRRVITSKVTSRARPQLGLRSVRTESGHKVQWIDVAAYTLPA